MNSLAIICAALLCANASFGRTAAVLTIEADASLALVTGPHVASEITRDRYFRLYHFPGMFSEELAAEMRALRVAPARGTGPYLQDKGGDTNRLGWAQDVNTSADRFAELYRKAALQHPGATHAIAGGSYPTCRPMQATGNAQNSTDATMHVSYNRAVEPENFPANADLIATWLDRIAAAGVSKPRYFSPFNEPDVSWKSGSNLAVKHADFARAVALRLRADHPGVLVSGPCTSWPYPGEDWRRWRAEGWERAFIERAGDVVGAYDFHFYTKEFWAYGKESPGFREETRQAQPHLHTSLWAGHHQILDFGKGEALLDLTQSLHLAKWNRPTPPVIISEFGRQGITPQLGPWASEYLSYLYGTTVTRLWMMFMDRPEIALTVPFILPVSDAGYGPRRGQALYTRPNSPADPTPVVTPMRDFYGFFRDLEGTRVPSSWSGLETRQEIGVFTVAARQGNTLFVLLHNATSTPLDFELRLNTAADAGNLPAGSTLQRMRWEGNLPADHRSPAPEGARWRRDQSGAEAITSPRIQLLGEETALARIAVPVATGRQVVVQRHYAPENLHAISATEAADFTFGLSENDLRSTPQSAELVVVFAAPLGGTAGQSLQLAFNGAQIERKLDLGLLEGWRHPVHPFRVSIPRELLKAGTNTVMIQAGPAGIPARSQIVSARLELRHDTKQ